ncbi:hypothetical protein [Halobacillus litoralis]|uniref:hypothetical protein n=1 Tax=Halobacillus litoralis TaxID=45668 RepID=UPI002492789A|nr:hypothetical protein [Halobacillus litoralis]
MDKKKLTILLAYAIVMTGLLLLTFGAEWNPSNYSYSLNNGTMVIEKGLSQELEEVSVGDRMDDVLRYTLAVSAEQQQWRIDVTVIGILLPFLLLLFIPNLRPLKKHLSTRWYVTIVLAILVVYAAYSIPNHISNINEVHEQVSRLLE